jgi:hypothetical protein
LQSEKGKKGEVLSTVQSDAKVKKNENKEDGWSTGPDYRSIAITDSEWDTGTRLSDLAGPLCACGASISFPLNILFKKFW